MLMEQLVWRFIFGLFNDFFYICCFSTYYVLVLEDIFFFYSMNSTSGNDQPDADSIKMFVGQIPRHWTEGDLTKFFEEYGPVYQISILRDKATHQSRGKS